MRVIQYNSIYKKKDKTMTFDNIDMKKLETACRDIYGESNKEQFGRFEELVKMHKDVFNTTDVEFSRRRDASKSSETTPTTTAARCFARQ